jgi:formylglycine-generating enzyme required for sulfatase activity
MISKTFRPLRIFSKLILLFLLTLPTFPSPVAAEGISVVSREGQSLYLYKDYYALVVGVGNYDKWPDLPNAAGDAGDVSSFLKQKGFEVTLLSDPDSQELKKALNDLVYKAGQERERGIVFYFAGHGTTQTLSDGAGLGWIIPRDCPLLRDDPEGFSTSAISMEAIETYSREILSRHVLMIFDSSFSGAVFSLESPVLEAITEKSGLPVRQYIIAGKEGEPAPDKGMIKRFLLKGLKGDADLIYDGYITGSELAVYLTNTVTKNSGGRLNLQYGKFKHMALARGDFVFRFVETKPVKGRIFVNVKPEGAVTRILNIRPRFYQGIELTPGEYHMEFTASGFNTVRKSIKLEAGEDRTVDISLGKLGDLITNSLGMKFAVIRPGSFMMGSPDEEHDGFHDEKKHSVTLTKRYYMQTSEVSVGRFRQFVRATGYKTEGETAGGCWVSSGSGGWKKKKESSWRNPGSPGTSAYRQTDKHPVTCISWNDAQAFIRWLSKKEGMTYGLPTEAEWEYACRAGTGTPFAFGRCLSTDQANYGGVDPLFPNCKDSYRINRKKPLTTGSLAANPWGLFNMHGNVSEWCRDWYGNYASRSVTDPKGPSAGTARVIRGGHYLANAYGSRSARRSSFPSGNASDVIGFRLVMRP